MFIDDKLDGKWVLCHNNVDVFHIIQVQKGQTLQTGQPVVEVFDTDEELKNKILSVCPTFFDNQESI